MKDPSRSAASSASPSSRQLALGVAGIALVSLVGGLWLFRVPLVDSAIRSYLSQADVEGDFAVRDAGLWGARLERVRLGPVAAPDAAASLADVRIAWGPLGPRIGTVRLNSPRLKVRIDRTGVSLGALDALRPEGGGRPMERLPDLGFDVRDGLAIVSTPAGDLSLRFAASGRLGHDFSARASIPAAALTRNGAGIRESGVTFAADTRNGVLVARLDGRVESARFDTAGVDALVLAGSASLPRRLMDAQLKVTATGATASFGGSRFEAPKLVLAGAPAAQDRWRLQATMAADAAHLGAWKAAAPEATLTTLSDLRNAAGNFSFHANEIGDGDHTAFEPSATGDVTVHLAARDGAVIAARGQLALPDLRISAGGREKALELVPALNGSPLGPILASGRGAIDRALSRFSLSTRFRLDWGGKAGSFAVDGPLSADAADGGGHLLVTPSQANTPALQVSLPSGAIEAHVKTELAGGALPPLRVTVPKFMLSGGNAEADGEIAVTDWRAAGGRIDLPRATFRLRGKDGAGLLSFDGAVEIAGKTEALSLEDLRAPLKLDVRWGAGETVSLRDRCVAVSVGELAFPGHQLAPRDITVCGLENGVLYGADRDGRRHGGFLVDRVRLPGTTADGARRPVEFSASRIEGRFTGDASRSRLEVNAEKPVYHVDFADRRVRFGGDLITARTGAGGIIEGVIQGGALDDPALPAIITAMRSHWSAGPEHGRTVVRFNQGAAHVTDKPVAPAPGQKEWKPRFNPLDIRNVSAALDEGKIDAEGRILLEAGARPLATFTARHDLATGEGRADITNPALTFSSKLDLAEISGLALGVVDHVSGPVGLDLAVTWDKSNVLSQGHVRPEGVSLNASALGPVSGISGDILFNDLFALTTPPGQRLTIRQLNPGVVVNDGVVVFQMLSPDRIRIEDARWPFAAGKLSVDPQVVQLGSETFQMTLSLRDVDVQELLSQLDFKDLTATGHVEGEFPLVFTPTGGRIVKGELHGDGKGGTIRYTGAAGDTLTGPGQIAFDALKNFAYDNIILELDGALDGDVVTAIRFSGENMQPVGGLVPRGALPIPGLSRVKVAGWPFKFSVSVRAPFRRLVKTSSDIQDARPLVNEAIGKPAIDPPPPQPK